MRKQRYGLGNVLLNEERLFLRPRMKQRIKKFAKRLLSALGINITRNQRYDALSLRVMQRVISRGDNCIDIGAHQGEVLDDMLRFAPEGEHHAFEPIPEMFVALKEKYRGNSRVNLHQVALADRCGETTFQHVTTNPAYSGLRQRTYTQAERVSEIKVEQRTLDNLLPSDYSVAFVKIDVEGAEYQVLKGAKETLKRTKPVVVFEHGLGASDHYGTTPEMVYDLLVEECGLTISLLDRFVVDAPPLSRDDFREEFYASRNYYFVAYHRP